jgi:xanthine/CO dehydrogenase XdhC/CoxF family maturation factor
VVAMDPKPLLVVGDGPVAEALVPMAELLGWGTTVAATLDEATAALPSADAVVVTSHDPDVDAPALAAAIAARPAYIGAMGSRGRQARRKEWLLAHGITEADLEVVHGPAGLDIGANTPAEIALSILAELVSTLRGASARGSLRDGSGPIHPHLAPGETFNPDG